MENIKVSIIIPVYNTEKYVVKCLDSLRNQTLSEYEIICVDDGSTDNSVWVINEYIHQDSRISLITQHNKYAGVARNVGMKDAKGKYILFLDSDDFFEDNMLQLMYDKCEKTSSDICICRAREYNNVSGQYLYYESYLNKEMLPNCDVFSREDIPDDIFRFTCDAAWNKLYLRKFVEDNKLTFQEIKRGNDLRFTNMTLALAERMTIVPEILVNYRVSHGGNLQSTYMDCPYTFYDMISSLYAQLKEKNVYEQVRRAYVNKGLGQFLNSLERMKDVKTYCKIYNKMKKGMLQELELTGYEEHYYYNVYEYKQLVRIMRYPAWLMYYIRQVCRWMKK